MRSKKPTDLGREIIRPTGVTISLSLRKFAAEQFLCAQGRQEQKGTIGSAFSREDFSWKLKD